MSPVEATQAVLARTGRDPTLEELERETGIPQEKLDKVVPWGLCIGGAIAIHAANELKRDDAPDAALARADEAPEQTMPIKVAGEQ